MKRLPIVPLLVVCGLTTWGASAAQAQQEAQAAAAVKTDPVGQVAAARNPRSERDSLPATAPKPDPGVVREMEKKKINLTLKGQDAQTALMQVLDMSEMSYDFDPAFYVTTLGQGLDLPPREVTLKMVNAPLNKALDSLTQAIGVGWTTEKDGENITIRIVKLRSTMTSADMLYRYTATLSGVPGLGGIAGGGNFTSNGFGGGSFGGGLGGYFGGTPLPNVMVKVDQRDKSIREILRSVVSGTKIEIAVDDDVPADLKKSFVFENVPLQTALEVICRGVGIGWRGEQTKEGLLLRFSKRYTLPGQDDAVKYAPTTPAQP